MEFSCSSITCECGLQGEISKHAEITGTLSCNANIYGNISGTSSLEGVIQIYDGEAPPDYTGAYEVTPSQETQTLPTAHKRMTQNVTINPIPEYYGLITWDGSILTVS